mgnify:CR=1 FL=1
MKVLKKAIRKLARRAGYDIVTFDPQIIGYDPFVDMQHFLKEEKKPLIFDVGANIGQSVDRFRDVFPKSTIHSFEPSPSAFEKLKVHCRDLPDVTPWNFGVGSINTTLPFLENEHSVMSSFLSPYKGCHGKIIQSTDVKIITLDSFSEKQKIEYIHILKSDTQGFDFEVFKGAGRLMKENRIGLIYFEFTFSEMYKGLPSFYDVFKYLSDNNFALVTFYESHFQKELVGWTDALLINRAFYQNRMKVLKKHKKLEKAG